MNKKETVTSLSLKEWNSGNCQGLDTLLERHLSWVTLHVRNRLGPVLRKKGETNDYVQDAMLQFLRYGPRIHINDEDHFRALLVRIVENSLRDKYDWYTARRRAISQERPLPSDTVLTLDSPRAAVPSPSQEAQQMDEEAWIRLGIELLEPDDREIIVLREWEGLSFADAGERLGLTADAAWIRHKRAVQKLGRKVGQLRRGKVAQMLGEKVA